MYIAMDCWLSAKNEIFNVNVIDTIGYWLIELIKFLEKRIMLLTGADLDYIT